MFLKIIFFLVEKMQLFVTHLNQFIIPAPSAESIPKIIIIKYTFSFRRMKPSRFLIDMKIETLIFISVIISAWEVRRYKNRVLIPNPVENLNYSFFRHFHSKITSAKVNFIKIIQIFF